MNINRSETLCRNRKATYIPHVLTDMGLFLNAKNPAGAGSVV